VATDKIAFLDHLQQVTVAITKLSRSYYLKNS